MLVNSYLTLRVVVKNCVILLSYIRKYTFFIAEILRKFSDSVLLNAINLVDFFSIKQNFPNSIILPPKNSGLKAWSLSVKSGCDVMLRKSDKTQSCKTQYVRLMRTLLYIACSKFLNYNLIKVTGFTSDSTTY